MPHRANIAPQCGSWGAAGVSFSKNQRESAVKFKKLSEKTRLFCIIDEVKEKIAKYSIHCKFWRKLKTHGIPKIIFQYYNNCVAEVTKPKLATLPENRAESQYKELATQEIFDKF